MKYLVFFILSVKLFAVDAGFSNLTDLESSIVLDMRYAGTHNFVGVKVDGYKAAKCFLTKPAAEALVKVQKELQTFGMSLRMYDCYRPQKAVHHFVRWARDLNDKKTKKEFYPKVDKSVLFKEGYIAEKSGHSRGSTADLTIDGLDMGTPFDFFDLTANTENKNISKTAMRNRLLLKAVMEKNGFKNYEMEWWHFTLRNEPHPDTYFDFDVE